MTPETDSRFNVRGASIRVCVQSFPGHYINHAEGLTADTGE
jgi:hypothetical protein